eukprot:403337891
MQAQQSVPEKLIVYTSVIIMPLVFLAQMVLGIYIVLTFEDPPIYIPFGLVVIWLQYTLCIVFFRDHYRNLLKKTFKSWAQLDQGEIRDKQERILYGISLNPFFPLVTRFFKFSVPVIVGLYVLYIIVYSFFFKKNLDWFEELNKTDQNLYLTFFIMCWALLAFPLTSLILSLAFIIIFGIPILIYELSKPQQIQVKIEGIKIIETFGGSKRIKINEKRMPSIDQCAICLNNFRHDELVVSLECHEAHIFHEECLNKWTENRLQCPMCRVRLVMVQAEDILHEVGEDGKIIENKKPEVEELEFEKSNIQKFENEDINHQSQDQANQALQQDQQEDIDRHSLTANQGIHNSFYQDQENIRDELLDNEVQGLQQAQHIQRNIRNTQIAALQINESNDLEQPSDRGLLVQVKVQNVLRYQNQNYLLDQVKTDQMNLQLDITDHIQEQIIDSLVQKDNNHQINQQISINQSDNHLEQDLTKVLPIVDPQRNINSLKSIQTIATSKNEQLGV